MSDKSNQKNNYIAVLIDGDNVASSQFDYIFKEILTYGNPVIRRIYADWAKESNTSKDWKDIFNKYALNQIQVSPNTKNKNSTDISLVIDAMDIMHQKNVDTFCIVSSDSDYTKLVLRLREENKTVIGFGDKNKTNEILANSCDEFKYYQALKSKYDDSTEKTYDDKSLSENTSLINAIKTAIDSLKGDDDIVNLGELKKQIIKSMPSFDSNNYGYKKFSELIEALGIWHMDEKNRNINLSDDSKLLDKNIKYGVVRKSNNHFIIYEERTDDAFNFNIPKGQYFVENDRVLFECAPNNTAENVRLYGKLTSIGNYGFIEGFSGSDVFIPDTVMSELRRRYDNLRVDDMVSYLKEESKDKGKSPIAYEIEKIRIPAL